MRFSRPSTGTVLGGIAIFIALGGTAFAAGATIVNISDPTNPSYVAHVTKAGALQTSGTATVSGTVTSQLAPPSAFVNQATLAVAPSFGCQTIAQPPSGKALIVRDITVDVYADPSPGEAQNVLIYQGTGCTGGSISDVNPATVGVTVLPFDAGLVVPAGSALSAEAEGGVEAETYVDGYSVASSAVPTATATARGTSLQR